MRVPRKIVVEIDNREKYPLVFPKTVSVRDKKTGKQFRVQVNTEMVKLDAGDYRIKGFENLVGVERKASVRELHNNFLTNDSDRQSRAFKKFEDAYEVCVLLLECMPSEFCVCTPAVREPERVLDVFLNYVRESGYELLVLPKVKSIRQRQSVGLFLLHYMINILQRK